MDVLRRVETANGRRALVEGFLGLHRGAEAVMAPWLADWPGLDFAARRRSSRLELDLLGLNGAPGDTPDQPFAPLADAGEALGLLYVLEGSTLGGAVIRKALLARGQDMNGLSFFSPYGEATGSMWRAFVGVLEAYGETGPEQTEAMAAGAVLGFESATTWLCQQRAAA